MEQGDNFNILVDRVEEYIETQKQLGKLRAIEKASIASSSIVSNLAIIFLFLLVFLFFSVALAYVIAEYYGKTSIGFGSVGLLYLLIGIVLYIKRDAWIKLPVSNSLISKLMDHE
jgi:hypothetical protein